MRTALALVLALLSFVVPVHASTGDCGAPGGGAPGLGVVEISPTDTAAGTFYVDRRSSLVVTRGNGMWVYEESNGHDRDSYGDLQRGGSSFVIPDDNEICTDYPDITPDQLVY